MSDSLKMAVVLAAIAVVTSCASSESPSGVMGNTNWLTSCDEDDDCEDDLSCSCGVCTRECTTTAECSELGGSVCDVESAALASVCASSLEMSVCLPACDNDDDCGGGLECVEQHCLPAEVVGASPSGDGDGDGSIGCGPNGAFVSANVAPDQECTFYAEGSAQLPIGQLDVSDGFHDDSSSGNCGVRGYRVNLLVYSCLQGTNDTLQLDSAEVELQDATGVPIQFDRTDSLLPNPFTGVGNSTIFPMRDELPSSGIISVEAIPNAYADELDGFDGLQIRAEIRVRGTTVGGSEVVLSPFLYPIEICNGCLTLCGADLSPETSLDDIYGEGVCRDNAGADDRICIDASCTSSSP